LSFIDTESIHLVFTSPPYHDLLDYGYSGQIGWGQSWAEYLKDMTTVFREIERVLAPGCYFAMNTGQYLITKGRSLDNHRQEIDLPAILSELVEKNTTLHRERFFIWDKIESKKYPVKPYPLQVYSNYDVEFIHVFRKPGERHVSEEIREKSMLAYKEADKFRSTIWSIHVQKELSRADFYAHLCPFPPELPERAIKLYSFIGDVVLDPFCGIANTCIAAARNGRHFIGVDMNPQYLEEAARRIEKTIGINQTQASINEAA